jgi:hypothetical protein
MNTHNSYSYLACKIAEIAPTLSPSSRELISPGILTDSSFSCYSLLLFGVRVSDYIGARVVSKDVQQLLKTTG